jgi:tRNA threonylcarbamoyladenosine biosynthesis protein TsaB
MACILLLETSTTVCTVALSVDGTVVFEKVSFEGQSHAALAGVFAAETIAYAKTKSLVPQAIAVSSGPGSYTGLRIGVSLAKGLCMGWNVPLIAVPTLNIMAASAIRRTGADDCLYCAMLDARRMEVYAAIYDCNGLQIRETKAEIVTSETYRYFTDRSRFCYFGNGAAKCAHLINSPNTFMLDDIYATATDMAHPAEKAFQQQAFENVAYFEPFYLKEFIATIPRHKVIKA